MFSALEFQLPHFHGRPWPLSAALVMENETGVDERISRLSRVRVMMKWLTDLPFHFFKLGRFVTKPSPTVIPSRFPPGSATSSPFLRYVRLELTTQLLFEHSRISDSTRLIINCMVLFDNYTIYTLLLSILTLYSSFIHFYQNIF
jgi:hypothetical protein